MNAREDLFENSGYFTMQKLNDNPPVRILSVLLLVLSASGLAYLVFFSNRGILPAVLRWTLIAGLGCFAGLASRMLLPGRTTLLRWLTSLIALLAGLVFLGLISRGDLGVRMPSPAQDGLNLSWLAQFALAGSAAYLSLVSWNTPSRPGSTQLEPRSSSQHSAAKSAANSRSGATPKPASASKSRRLSTQAARKNPPLPVQRLYLEKRWQQAQRGLRNWQRKIHRWWEHGIQEAPAEPPPAKKRKKPIQLHANRLRRTPSAARTSPSRSANVRLIGKEEHRCPYCLEEVLPRDPRGVRVCPICHTHHHADCWAVTGTCQVPHYHE
jgi:ribosomal protein L37AE/L43A